MDKLRTGLTSYLSTGEFTPDFMSDVDMMISKVYEKWCLHEDLDEFTSFCWAKIVNALKIYSDSGALSTYLYSVIWNEARRIYSKHKKVSFDDIDTVTESVSVWSVSQGSENTLMLRDKVCSFARRAYSMGVYVDQENLFRNYCLGNLTPAVKSFMWGSVLGYY